MLNTELSDKTRPQSILVIGCGLIGTSLALAVHEVDPTMVLDGVEINPVYQEEAREKRVFRRVFAGFSEKMPSYDLAVLAVPVDIACALLPQALEKGALVMDVCSVKEAVCETAERLQARERFIPSHPMAGLASAGPNQATGGLFQDRPWLFIEGWTAAEHLLPLVQSMGARIEFLESASRHDETMAIVSHGIHLVSLSAMLAYGDALEAKGLSLAHLTGPAFRDITRLSASPSGFWASTLRANAQAVVEHVERVISRLQSFQSTLTAGGENELVELLDTARMMHEEWRGEQS